MDPHSEQGVDRRGWLVTVARGATVAGTLTAAATLLVRRGQARDAAPCGIVAKCARCALSLGCPVQSEDVASSERKGA